MVRIDAQQLEQFEKEGYMIFNDLFTAAEMDDLASHIDVLDEETDRRLKQVGQEGISIPSQIVFTAHIHSHDPAIKQFIADQRFVDITTTLLGPDIRLYWDQSVYKKPEASRDFPWHQDTGYVITEPLEYLTCWLAVDDANINNGCVWIQPGSHKHGLVEHQPTPIGLQCYFEEDPGMPVELKKGSMVVFNSLLYHRSTPNLSSTVRKGYVIQYSIDGSYNPSTGVVFKNGPLIAQAGQPVLID